MAIVQTRAQLVYWFAGATEIPEAWQSRFAPGYWAPKASPMAGENAAVRHVESGGPSGDGAGLVAAFGDFGLDPKTALDLDGREWSEIEPGVWIGIDANAEPSYYLRSKMADSVYVITVDRGQWLVPVALLSAENYSLPSVDQLRLGEWTRNPREQYRPLAEYAEIAYRCEIDGEPLPAFPWVRDVAIAALQANYALTAAELGAFEVLNDDVYGVVIEILTDRRAREAAAEKKSQDG